MTSAPASPIPLVVVEEHHELFCVWHQAVSQGWLRSTRNALVHVDEHSDMSLPRLRRPLSSIRDQADMVAFMYEELNIGNFIWPAVYQGIFAKVNWVRSTHAQPIWKTMRICAKTSDACEFVTGSSLSNTRFVDAPDQQPVEYTEITPRDRFPQHDWWTLDIDLDYFCCNHFPDLHDERVEITRESFEQIAGDPYHFLRIAPGSKISYVREGNRYFLLFNAFPHRPVPEYDAGSIGPRLDDLIEWLRGASLPPKLITICRSVRSGYTPKAESRNIESLLRAALESLYTVDTLAFDLLLAEGHQSAMLKELCL